MKPDTKQSFQGTTGHFCFVSQNAKKWNFSHRLLDKCLFPFSMRCPVSERIPHVLGTVLSWSCCASPRGRLLAFRKWIGYDQVDMSPWPGTSTREHPRFFCTLGKVGAKYYCIIPYHDTVLSQREDSLGIHNSEFVFQLQIVQNSDGVELKLAFALFIFLMRGC